MSHLTDLVGQKIRELGIPDAADFFKVKESLIRQWDKGSKGPSLEAVERVFKAPDLEPGGKLVESEWEGKKIAILLPWYREAHPLTAFSLMGLIDRAKCMVIMSFGDAFISHSRNKLATQFLKTGVEWCFWADSDMIFPFGNPKWFNAYSQFNLPDKFAGMHTFNRLLSHNKSLVGGTYFGRRWGGRPVYAEGASQKDEAARIRRGPVDTIKPTRWVGTGAMLCNRQVFLDIEKEFPHLARVEEKAGHWFTPSEHDLLEASIDALEILNDKGVSEIARISKVRELLHNGRGKSMAHSKLGMGEDVQFCIRAAQCGHQPYVDLGLFCGHLGDLCFGPKSHD